jgi:aminoglycoside phosphotransferase (APT) family kinase protein
MPKPRMNPDEIDIDSPLVRRLIHKQFPQWADLPITEVRSAGTDNAIYRLGNEMAARLPRRPGVAAGVATEGRWLPQLASLLPLAVPVPLAQGLPAEGFPFPWSVHRWLDGENVADEPEVDLPDAAVQLGRFVAALQRIDPSGGPPPPFRGGPVSILDDRVRGEIRDLGADGVVNQELVTAAWETGAGAPVWDRAPVWVHADLYPGNLLARHGRLAAVIDFGGLGVGDPAIDMLPAWAWLTAETRGLFRAEVNVDDATWVRGRAWALSLGIGAVHFYRVTNPVLAASGQLAIAEVLSDYQRQHEREP